METFENADDTPSNWYIHVVDGRRSSVTNDVNVSVYPWGADKLVREHRARVDEVYHVFQYI